MLIRVTVELDDGATWTRTMDQYSVDAKVLADRLVAEEFVGFKLELDGGSETDWQEIL